MNLNTVQEIEHAIDALTSDQREELYIWLDEHYLHAADVQLKAANRRGPLRRAHQPGYCRSQGRKNRTPLAPIRPITAQTRNFGKSIGLCRSISVNGRTSNLRCSEPTRATVCFSKTVGFEKPGTSKIRECRCLKSHSQNEP